MEDRLLYRTLRYAHKICRNNRFVYLSELEEHETKMPDAVFSVMQRPETKSIFSCGNDSHGVYYYLKECYDAMTPSELQTIISKIVK